MLLLGVLQTLRSHCMDDGMDAVPVLRVIEKENVFVCVTVSVTPTTSSDQTVPGVGTEVTVDTCLPKREIVSMYTHD